MPVESSADRASFLDLDEFALSVVITPSGGSPSTVNGIFDDEYALIGELDGVEGVSTSNPVFLVRSGDVAGLSLIGAQLAVTIDAVERTFSIVESKPDGTGMTVLRLHEGS